MHTYRELYPSSLSLTVYPCRMNVSSADHWHSPCLSPGYILCTYIHTYQCMYVRSRQGHAGKISLFCFFLFFPSFTSSALFLFPSCFFSSHKQGRIWCGSFEIMHGFEMGQRKMRGEEQRGAEYLYRTVPYVVFIVKHASMRRVSDNKKGKRKKKGKKSKLL
jgi:hypothetical protein